MTNVHELPVQPNETVMAQTLHAIFANSMTGRVEIAWIGSSSIGARLFDLTEIDEAAAFAARANQVAGRNVYFSAGLRSYEADENKRGSKADVISVAALKVDCDDPGCLTTAINKAVDANFPPTLVMFTGREPHLRGSLWWVLEEPDPDTFRAERIEQALIAAFSADRSAWNCDRIMRLAGSVAWPVKKGRVTEITGCYDAVTRKAPYTFDEIESALTRTAAPKITDTIASIEARDFNSAKRQIDVPELLAAATEPGQFHENATPAIMSLVRRGVPPDLITELLAGAIAAAGVNTQQRTREMISMVRGAVRKVAPTYSPPQPESSPTVIPGGLEATPNSPFVSIDDMLNRPPAEFIVDGYLTEGGLSALWGASGAFKSFIAIDLAMSVATGADWHGRATMKRPVIYICAEGQYGFGVRALAWKQHRCEPDTDLTGFHILPVPVNFLDPNNVHLLIEAATEHLPGISSPLIVVDTLARNFGPGNENETRDMNMFVASAGLLQSKMNAHVLLIHHTGKDDTKGERGAYSLRGALDTSLKLVRDGTSDRISLEHPKQKEGPEHDPLPLRMVRVEATHPRTGEIVTSLVPVIDEAPRGPGAQPKLSPSQSRALALLRDLGGDLSDLTIRSGIDKSNLRKALKSLLEMRVITVTSGGFYDISDRNEIPRQDQ